MHAAVALPAALPWRWVVLSCWVWQLLVSESQQPFHRMTGHTAAVLALSITFDGTLVLSSSEDKTARVRHIRHTSQH